MKNRKITVDRPQLSAEEVLAGKDFNAVLGNHQVMTKPFYKQTWFFGTAGLASLGLIIGSTFAFDENEAVTEPSLVVMNTEVPPPAEESSSVKLIAMNDFAAPTNELVLIQEVNNNQTTTPIEKTTTLERTEFTATEEFINLEEVHEEIPREVSKTEMIKTPESPPKEKQTSTGFGFFDLNPRISNKIGGSISRKQLMDDKGLVTNTNVEIVHFELHLINGRGGQVFEEDGHLLTNEMKMALKGVAPGEEIYFEDIQGVTANGEVVRLNPLRYTLLN